MQMIDEGVWAGDFAKDAVSSDLPRPSLDFEVGRWSLDISVVDGHTGKTLGRPWITVMSESRSLMIVGVDVSFESLSVAVDRCLANGISPRTLDERETCVETRATGHVPTHDRPYRWTPDRLLVENAEMGERAALAEVVAALSISIVVALWPDPRTVAVNERICRKLIGAFERSTDSRSSDAGTSSAFRTLVRPTPSMDDVQRLVRRIVDEYNSKYQGRLKSSPLETWTSVLANRSHERDGTLPPPNADHGSA